MEVQNQDINRAFIEETGILRDENPINISKNAVPTISINCKPRIKLAYGSASDALSALLLLTSSKKRTFLIGASISYTKDVNATSLYSQIIATPVEGTSGSALFSMRYEPNTAGSNTSSVNFPYPIELLKNTNITITNSTNVASVDATGTIYYFEID